MKTFLFIALLVCFTQNSFAQELKEGEVIKEGKIIMNNLEEKECEFISISDGSIRYYDINTGIRNDVNIENVKTVLKLNHSGKSTIWVGALVGLGAGIAYSIASIETETSHSTYYTEEKTTIQTWSIYAFSAIGALAGYLIYEGSADWETVYSNHVAFFKNIKMKNGQHGLMLSYQISF